MQFNIEIIDNRHFVSSELRGEKPPQFAEFIFWWPVKCPWRKNWENSEENQCIIFSKQVINETKKTTENKHDLLADNAGYFCPLLSARDRNLFGFTAFYLAEKKGPILFH